MKRPKVAAGVGGGFEDVPDEGVDAVVVEGVGGGTLSYCMPPVLRLGRP